MLRTDYIQRMVEQIARMLASVMRLRKNKQFVQAEQSLDDTARMLFGLGMNLMLTMDLQSLISSLHKPEKILVLTRLLKIQAELAQESGQNTRSQQALLRALHLFAHLQGQGIALDAEALSFEQLAQAQIKPDMWPPGS